MIAVAVVMVRTSGNSALAQPARPATTPAQPPATGAGQVLLDPNDTVILLLDHQTGLFQTVKDITIQELRTNAAVLAKLATLANIPVIYTASEPEAPTAR